MPAEPVKSNFGNFLKKLGENSNTPTIAVCLIAFFKGIFRPMFTLMDKKQNPESKKYAAFREGLTEVAALPIYATMPFIASWLAEKLAKKMASGANKENIKATSKFIGLCVATLLVPAACNIIQPPIMKAYKKHEDAKKAKMGVTNALPNVNQPLQTTFKGNYNHGMKVGG